MSDETNDEKQLERALNLLDALYDARGHEAAKEVGRKPRTPERQAKLDAMLMRARAALQNTRERVLADSAQEARNRADPIPVEILAMKRSVLIAQICERTEIESKPDFLDTLTIGELQRLLAYLDQADIDGT